MELKSYLVKAYGLLVKANRWSLEENEEGKLIVPEEYQIAVAEYLVTQN